MQSKELRIGNRVHATLAGNVGNGDLVEHTIKNGADIDNAHWYFEIRLTEDWFTRRFGFKKDVIYFNSSKGTQQLEILYKGDYGISKNGDFWSLNYIYFNGDRPHPINSKIEYVHQLQNLYRDLKNGEELEIMKE